MLLEWLDALAGMLLVVGYLAASVTTSICLYNFLASLLMVKMNKKAYCTLQTSHSFKGIYLNHILSLETTETLLCRSLHSPVVHSTNPYASIVKSASHVVGLTSFFSQTSWFFNVPSFNYVKYVRSATEAGSVRK